MGKTESRDVKTVHKIVAACDTFGLKMDIEGHVQAGVTGVTLRFTNRRPLWDRVLIECPGDGVVTVSSTKCNVGSYHSFHPQRLDRKKVRRAIEREIARIVPTSPKRVS